MSGERAQQTGARRAGLQGSRLASGQGKTGDLTEGGTLQAPLHFKGTGAKSPAGQGLRSGAGTVRRSGIPGMDIPVDTARSKLRRPMMIMVRSMITPFAPVNDPRLVVAS